MSPYMTYKHDVPTVPYSSLSDLNGVISSKFKPSKIDFSP